ncbi:hypothetical protein [Rhodococcus pseudokoreensis]|uniref:hypothetical protein n=1 Tax=Rhodococcus pseudokoreensis TaxID=2811421 RepID=UPI001F12878C|nr:hypothetical protein [Rhodococcus pseudokoreensis]
MSTHSRYKQCRPCAFLVDAGNALVLTTIRGNARHHVDHDATADTPAGDTFVADCSRIDYLVEFSPDHVQLNLTIPHRVLADTAVRWWGFDPGDVLWQRKCAVGGDGLRPREWLTSPGTP